MFSEAPSLCVTGQGLGAEDTWSSLARGVPGAVHEVVGAGYGQPPEGPAPRDDLRAPPAGLWIGCSGAKGDSV